LWAALWAVARQIRLLSPVRSVRRDRQQPQVSASPAALHAKLRAEADHGPSAKLPDPVTGWTPYAQ
jgi:hypothetical protein